VKAERERDGDREKTEWRNSVFQSIMSFWCQLILLGGLSLMTRCGFASLLLSIDVLSTAIKALIKLAGCIR